MAIKKTARARKSTSRKSRKSVSRKSVSRKSVSRKKAVKKTVRKIKKASPEADEKRSWKKITVTIGHSRKKSFDESDLTSHLKKYAGKVVLWDFFGKLRSSDFDKVKVKGDQIIFRVALDGLKDAYGTTSDVMIKKQINAFDPFKSTEKDNISSFWKIVNFNGDHKMQLFVKKINISK